MVIFLSRLDERLLQDISKRILDSTLKKIWRHLRAEVSYRRPCLRCSQVT